MCCRITNAMAQKENHSFFDAHCLRGSWHRFSVYKAQVYKTDSCTCKRKSFAYKTALLIPLKPVLFLLTYSYQNQPNSLYEATK